MAKKNKVKKDRYAREKRKSRILYVICTIVILVPVVLLGYIYLGAKESSGKPTAGSRFASSLDPAITTEQINQINSALQGEGIDGVQVALESATLRVLVDLRDDADGDAVNEAITGTYDKIIEVLPVNTYFTNKENGGKMYDLDIHVYNFIPTKDQDKTNWIYKERTKNAASTEMVTDTLSSPKNEDEANRLLNPPQPVENPEGGEETPEEQQENEQ